MSALVAGPEHRRQLEHARAVRAKFFPAQPIRVVPRVDGGADVMAPEAEQSIALAAPPEPPFDEPAIELPPATVWLSNPNDLVEERFQRRFDEEFQKLFHRTAPVAHRTSSLRSKDIIVLTAREFKVTVEEIKGPRRQRRLVEARMTAMWRVAIANPAISLPSIGRMFGGKDHTTVLHALRRVEAAYAALERHRLIEIIMQWTGLTLDEAAAIADREDFYYRARRQPPTKPTTSGAPYSKAPMRFLP